MAFAPASGNAGTIFGNTSDTDVRSDPTVLGDTTSGLLPGGSGSPVLDRCSVFVFQLPSLGAVATPFTTAEFKFNLSSITGTPPNVDLYGLGSRSTSTVLASDYYGETATQDSTDATKLQNNILISSSGTGSISTSLSGGTALRDYLNAQYAGGAGAGDYVFLRLSSKSAPTSVQRYLVTSADGGTSGPPDTRPRIIYNEAPVLLPRPFIWVRDSEKTGIVNKIANNPWATTIYNGMVSRVAADLASHQSNRDAFLRELPVEWTLATPRFKTIPAFSESSVRFPTEAKFNDALDCAVLFYLTGNTNYARCAADILHNAVKTLGVVNPSSNDNNGGWIFQEDFLKEARVSANQLPIVYDFLFSYLHTNQVYDVKTAGMVDFNFTAAQDVFRTFYQLARDHGQKDTNWSSLMSTTMLNNLLALDSNSERAGALQVYLVTGSSRQASLQFDYRDYTEPGDIWHESLQYAGAVGIIRTNHMILLERYDPSLNLFNTYPNFPLSLPRISYMRYPNGQQISFGDGPRDAAGQPFNQYELVYQHALARGRTDLTSFFGSLINAGVAAGDYNRSTIRNYSTLGQQNEPLQLLWQAGTIPEPSVAPELPRTDTLPFAGITLQRNPAPANNATYGLMGFVGGAGHVHSHASGMSMEIFGLGQVMGAKSGRDSYGTAIHEKYYRCFASNNTVIVNGASRGQGNWEDIGINTVQTVAMEPQPLAAAVSPNNSFTCSFFADNKGTQAQGIQQRTLAIVRTSPTTGFYVDVFRSRSTVTNRTATTLNGNVTDQYHDYIYRNFGETAVDLRADGVTLPLVSQPNRFKNDIGDAYDQPGWRYFTNTAVSYPTSQSVRARFVATVSGTQRYMSMHLPAVASREYAKVNGPAIAGAPSPYDAQVAPALVVRQIGDAWDKPFASVYEPHFGSTGGTVQNVTQLLRGNVVVGVKVESTVAGDSVTHYVLTHPSSGESYTNAGAGLSFTGRFGIIADLGDGKVNLYLGQGSSISYGSYSVSTVSGTNSEAEVRFVPGQAPVITANSPVNVIVDPSANPTWVPTAASPGLDWTNAANWTSSAFPNAVGKLALMNGDIAGNQTVNVNSPITLGDFKVGDSSGGETTLLRKNTNGSLTFDATGTAMTYLTRAAGGTGTVTLANDLNVTLNDDLTVRLADGSAISTLAIAGNLAGPNKNLVKESASLTLALSGTNTYTGTTTLSGGVLRLDSPAALGSGNLVLSGDGVLGLGAGDFSRSDGTGAGQVQWAGNGGFAAFGADRSVSLGTMSWASSSLVGNALVLGHETADATLAWVSNISFAGGSRTIQVDDGSSYIDAVISGALSGGGTFNKSGAGTLAITNDSSSYTAATKINDGTLMLGDGGSTGQIPSNSGSLINNSTFAVNRNNITTQATDLGGKTITGTGGLAQVGSGSTVLTLPNTYDGPTVIRGGTLVLGANDVLPDGTAVSIDNATLDAVTFADSVGTLQISEAAVIQLDAGSALAFANSAAISWTGGSLQITGTFVSGASLRFGSNSGGLTTTQLASISSAGFGSFSLDASGYLVGTPQQGYAAWKAINAPIGTPADDDDGDSVANGIEYVLGGTGSTRDLEKLPKVSTSGGNMVFTFIRDQASIDGATSVVIEVGSDLSGWPTSYPVPDTALSNNPGLSVLKNSPSAGQDTVTLTLPVSPGGKNFARLKATP